MVQPEIRRQSEDTEASAQCGHVSRGFLQTVVDSLPSPLIVVDRDYNIVLANQLARARFRCRDSGNANAKCYRCFHGCNVPCSEMDEEPPVHESDCPVTRVFASGEPVRVYHTHHDISGSVISVSVDAAPIFDDSGEVLMVIETCRDVTERTLSRQLLRIGNRQMTMGPLLNEYAAELRQYTNCANVGIHVLEESFEKCTGWDYLSYLDEFKNAHCDTATVCICLQILGRRIARELPPTTRCGSLRLDRFSEFVGAVSASQREQGDFVPSECESLALIPIRLDDMVVGLLHVADPRPNAISAEMVESLERLSLELATAIYRVRIQEQLQAARDELETRVQERTEELTKSNQALQKEIAERGRLEREILHVSVKEQQRIGQELHDGLGQLLTGLSYLAQNLLLTLKAKGAPEEEMAGELAHSIPQALGQIQRIVRGLIPLEIGARDLEIALDVLTSNVSKLTGITCEFNADGCERINDDDTAIQIYRIAQEAITNAVKHAQASRIDVTLGTSNGQIRLEISDDGVGIQMNAAQGPGCGLRSMNHRARATGGGMSICRRVGGGTTVLCTFSQASDESTDTGESSHDA